MRYMFALLFLSAALILTVSAEEEGRFKNGRDDLIAADVSYTDNNIYEVIIPLLREYIRDTENGRECGRICIAENMSALALDSHYEVRRINFITGRSGENKNYYYSMLVFFSRTGDSGIDYHVSAIRSGKKINYSDIIDIILRDPRLAGKVSYNYPVRTEEADSRGSLYGALGLGESEDIEYSYHAGGKKFAVIYRKTKYIDLSRFEEGHVLNRYQQESEYLLQVHDFGTGVSGEPVYICAAEPDYRISLELSYGYGKLTLYTFQSDYIVAGRWTVSISDDGAVGISDITDDPLGEYYTVKFGRRTLLHSYGGIFLKENDKIGRELLPRAPELDYGEIYRTGDWSDYYERKIHYFAAAINSREFAYRISGIEFIYGFGIYDMNTGTATAVPDTLDMTPFASSGGYIYSYGASWDSMGFYTLHRTDIKTLRTTAIAMPDKEYPLYHYPEMSKDGRYIVFTDNIYNDYNAGETEESRLYIYDTTEDAYILNAGYTGVYGPVESGFTDDGVFLLFSDPYLNKEILFFKCELPPPPYVLVSPQTGDRLPVFIFTFFFAAIILYKNRSLKRFDIPV